jgi:hypothetical protein
VLLINVNPLLTTEQAIESLKNVTEYVQAQNGTVIIEELPSWKAFFTKYCFVSTKGSLFLEFLALTEMTENFPFEF